MTFNLKNVLNNKNILSHILLVLFAILFQIQLKQNINLSLYLNQNLDQSLNPYLFKYWTVSDIFSPFLLLFLFVNTVRTEGIKGIKTLLTPWQWPLWLLVFTLWITFSLVFGNKESGYISLETIINKYLGWWLLVFYFLIGGMVVRHQTQLEYFLKALFISSSLISVFCLVNVCIKFSDLLIDANHLNMNFFNINLLNVNFVNLNLLKANFDGIPHVLSTPQGLWENSTAFGLFSAFVVLLQIPFFAGRKLFATKCHLLIMIPNILSIFLSDTKPAMAALVIGTWCFLVHTAFTRYKINSKYILGIMLLSCFLIYNFTDTKKITSYPPVAQLIDNLNAGLLEHQKSVSYALELFKNHPLTGIGLGKLSEQLNDHNDNQIAPYDHEDTNIHQNIPASLKINNTLLLLLTEIGLIGVVLYLWFIVKGGRQLFYRKHMGDTNEIIMAMLMIIPAFIAVSFTTEIFFQRFIWVIWGAALMAVPTINETIDSANDLLERKTFSLSPYKI